MESLHWYKSEKFDPNYEDDIYWVETDPEIREYHQLYDLSPKDYILEIFLSLFRIIHKKSTGHLL